MQKIELVTRIPSENLKKHVKRKLSKSSILIYLFFISILFAFYLSPLGDKVNLKQFFFTILFFTILIYLGSLLEKKKIKSFAENTIYFFNENGIKIQTNTENLNSLLQFGMERNKIKGGKGMYDSLNQSINFDKIYRTIISSNYITFEAKSTNLYNGTGKILLPKEVDKYDEIKEYIKANPLRFFLKEE